MIRERSPSPSGPSRAPPDPALSMRTGEPLWRHSSWRIGGAADYFCEPTDRSELTRALAFARQSGLPHLVIGQGTNLLFADEGYRGVVIKIGRAFAHVQIEDTVVEAEAGVLVCRLARRSGQAGLSGIEHIVGIPGTLGGLIVMNGGSLRKSIGDRLQWVEFMDPQGQTSRCPASECGFAYRSSRFQTDDGLVILRARLILERRSVPDIRRWMLRILRDRRRKFPRKLPNCGSVFKSSPELLALAKPPGRMIEECGLKGRRVGDAEVSPLHANFINNIGKASSGDTLKLICEIREAVHGRFGVWLEAEVKYVMPQGDIVPAHQVCRLE